MYAVWIKFCNAFSACPIDYIIFNKFVQYKSKKVHVEEENG